MRTKPEQVWPWGTQIRLAPYSYDWLDNLGRRSPRDLRGLPEPVVGDSFSAALGGRPFGRIIAVEAGVGTDCSSSGAVVLVTEGSLTALRSS